MINYLGFGLILESFWVAVEDDFFGAMCKNPLFQREKRAPVVLIRFFRLPHACYGFVRKVCF